MITKFCSVVITLVLVVGVTTTTVIFGTMFGTPAGIAAGVVIAGSLLQIGAGAYQKGYP